MIEIYKIEALIFEGKKNKGTEWECVWGGIQSESIKEAVRELARLVTSLVVITVWNAILG